MQDYGDPFNWKFPKREDTMMLSTINNRDAGFQVYNPKEIRGAGLVTQDIQGARPLLKPYQFTNKMSYINKNDDIQGTQPKKIEQFTNKESFVLKNEDIKGTKTQVNQFQTTRTYTNPLVPQYQLPSFENRLPTPPKFMRNTLDIDDIEGTKPNPKVFKPRKEDIYTEIPGSRPKERFIPKQQVDSLNVTDINQFKRFISNRETNPLAPVYEVPHGESSYNKYSLFYNPDQYGPIKGTLSRVLHPVESKKKNFNLDTIDLHGAQADTFTDTFLKRKERKDFRQTNLTKDMPWVQSGSLRKGIQTIRSLNPLCPKYQYLGDKEEEQDKLNELVTQSKFPQTTKAISQASEKENGSQKRGSISSQGSNRFKQIENGNQFMKSGSQIGSRRASQQSQASKQSNQIQYSQTQAQFRPPKPTYDTLGNKIQDREVKGNAQQQFCGIHNKNEPIQRSGLASSKTEANLSSAQKLDKFIK